jgi:hypothetical protein
LLNDIHQLLNVAPVRAFAGTPEGLDYRGVSNLGTKMSERVRPPRILRVYSASKFDPNRSGLCPIK